MAEVNWNQNEYEAKNAGDFPVLPAGRYLGIILDSEKKKTQRGTGEYLEFAFEVIAPKEFAKSKLWARLNVHNQNETAQRIGREQFNALCEAAGVQRVDRTERLHNKKVVLIVKVTEYEGKERNEVAGFELYAGSQGTARPAEQPATKPAAQTRPPEQPKREPATTGASSIDDDDIPF